MSLARRTTIATARGSVVVEYRGGGFVRASRTDADHPVKTPDRTLRAKLDELASRVRRLTISARDPERFFEDRSEIAAELLKLAGALRA